MRESNHHHQMDEVNGCWSRPKRRLQVIAVNWSPHDTGSMQTSPSRADVTLPSRAVQGLRAPQHPVHDAQR